MSVPAPISATVEMNAGPDEVWRVVSDLARMPEFSPELRKAFVLGRPGLGANVIGINRRKAVVWPTSSKVVRWEPGRAVAWKTRESGATWIYELEPTATGTGGHLQARAAEGHRGDVPAWPGTRRRQGARHRAGRRHPDNAGAHSGKRRGVLR